MMYGNQDIASMSGKEVTEAITEIWKKLGRIRGHKLRDRLHKQREELEEALKHKH